MYAYSIFHEKSILVHTISLFSNKLFKTGRTFLSAFSMPSRIRILPWLAARTADWSIIIQKKKEEN